MSENTNSIFSKEAISIIEACSNINNSMLLSYPKTTITNPTRDINCVVDFGVVSEQNFPEIGLWDASSFISSVSILEDPSISLEGNKIIAKDDCSTIEYVTSSASILGESICDEMIITSTLGIDSIVTLDMNTALVNKIKGGVKIFKNLKDLQFSKVGDILTVSTMNKESFNSSNNKFSMKLDPTEMSGDDFQIVIPSDNFLSLPQMDYTMQVHTKGGQYRISMTNSIFKFVLSLKK